jgi:signal transduction histidine kinase
MLSHFLLEHRHEVLERSLAKIRSVPATAGRSAGELIDDLSLFVDELILALRKARDEPRPAGLKTTGEIAPAHARQRWRIGFDVEQVVHDYGFLCDAITEAAQDARVSIDINEYRVLNQSLDTAIAEAVNQYMKSRDRAGERQVSERIGYIVHELRNALATSLLSLQAIRSAKLSASGRTADALERSLRRQQELIDYLLSDIRVRTRELKKERLRAAQLFDEIEAATSLHARKKNVRISFAIDPQIGFDADRLLITSALMNLTLNAIKYTRAGGQIWLRGQRVDHALRFEVEDECGGLPEGNAEELFQPFVQRNANQSGLGLGLALARQSVETHGGSIAVRNLPGKGCVFVVRMPA